MTSIRASFLLIAEADPTNKKTTITRIKSIQPLDKEETYFLPDDSQSLSAHAKLCELPVIKAGIKSITRRGQKRLLKVTLNDELAKIYFDEEENVFFNSTYLDAASHKPASVQPEVLASYKRTVSSAVKEMVLEKFNGKNHNVNIWLEIYECECKRVEIEESKFAEVLRLFLEGPASEWFALTLKLTSIEAGWLTLRNSLSEYFGDKDWVDVASAYYFKYIGGSLAEYAIKKINLLLNADPDMPETTRINMVAIGIPSYIRDKINKKPQTHKLN